MKIISARLPVQLVDGNISLMVQFEGNSSELPFAASPTDTEDYGRDLYSRAMSGEFGIVSPIVPPTLDYLKSIKLSTITQDRDLACTQDVTALSHPWQSDIKSQQLLGQAITLASAGLPLPTVWRDANNVDVPVTTLADLLQIAGAIATQVQTAYTTSWSRKAALALATTPEEVEAV